MNTKFNLPRFLVNPAEIGNESIVLTKENYHKAIRVLRLKAGNNLIILNNLYKEYLCYIKFIEKNKIICEILNCKEHATPVLKLILAQSVIKKTGME